MRRFLLLFTLLFSHTPQAGAFLVPTRQTHHPAAVRALPTPEESAQALTDFMAKAHEEKIRALADLDQKYKQQVEELQAKLAQYETTTTKNSTAVASNGNSYEFPATNKELTKKVAAYRDFIADYIVKAQIAKVSAVAAAEKKMRDQYDELLSGSKTE